MRRRWRLRFGESPLGEWTHRHAQLQDAKRTRFAAKAPAQSGDAVQIYIGILTYNHMGVGGGRRQEGVGNSREEPDNITFIITHIHIGPIFYLLLE